MKKAVLIFSVAAIGCIYFLSTHRKPEFQSKASEAGYKLAKVYCKSCHQFPEAGSLDKKTWVNFVLPKMSLFLGFRHMDGITYFEDANKAEIMPLERWQEIVAYYIQESPKELKRPDRDRAASTSKQFTPFVPKFKVKNPATTYVGLAPENSTVWFGDGKTQHLYHLDADGSVKDSLYTGKGLVHVHRQGNQWYLLTMGVLYPSDEKLGKLVSTNMLTGASKIIADRLQRPVYAEYADLNADALADLIVCEYGNTRGQLSWFENKGKGQAVKHLLRASPGAVRTQVVDVNKDGRPDVLALFAQGDEGCFVFYNLGNGKFKEQRILQLPPYFGSNYFELADFNKDGHVDILATNGDNGDYPPILKPYHGIRIYLNDGKANFEEAVFLPMFGASKAVARDFDGDGDLDLASIAYFPDFDQTPQENFIYWTNEGNLNFHPHTWRESVLGRWLTLDAGDADKDGDEDIVLGNAVFTLGLVPQEQLKKWEAYAPSVVIFKNQKNQLQP